MSLIGFRHLTWLKSRLLPAGADPGTDYDVDLTNIGLAVAAAFDSYTGRKLVRTEDFVQEFPADREMLVMQCYPVETVSAAEFVCMGMPSDILTSIRTIHQRAGIITLQSSFGDADDLLRFTYTGGYWCEDDDTLPEGAFPLPDDLLGAWVQQCRAVCEAENIFRTKASQKPDKKSGAAISLDNLTLLPGVKTALQLHMRFA